MRIHTKLSLLAAMLALTGACQSPSGHAGDHDSVGSRSELLPTAENPVDAIGAPHRVEQLFGDSANRALFWDSESEITTKGEELRVDGLSLVYIAEATLPLRIQTSLMHIDVLELPLLVRADAYDKHAGQSLEVFSGALKVGKSYESPFPDIDTLRAGNLYMINKDIDLSEKETLDDSTALVWWKTVYSREFPNALTD